MSDNYDPAADDEFVLNDPAAAVVWWSTDILAHLTRLDKDLDSLWRQLISLDGLIHSNGLEDIDKDEAFQFLAYLVSVLRSEGVKEAIRDVASRLPVRSDGPSAA
jgi:hypothetical protein